MRQVVEFSRGAAILVAAVIIIGGMPDRARAGIFDFLFSGNNNVQHAPQASAYADPFGVNPPPAPPPAPAPVQRAEGGGRSSGYCVRSCDGRYFAVQAQGGSTAAQMCQAFCPASATEVYFGSSIDGAVAASGERYSDSDNAFAFRKALKADCTCNGREPTGLAPVDLSLDTTLRRGDVIATASGLVAYSGIRVGNSQTAEFTPVASYPGLTADVRSKLGEMKVAPVSADIADEIPPQFGSTDAAPATTVVVPKSALQRAKRAEIH